MKKQIALVLALATLSTAALSGCTGGSPSGTAETPGGESSSGNTGTAGVVNVYNWGEYIDMSVLEDFEAETGIKVNYQTFESNEALYGKLAGGAGGYDVIIPSDYMIGQLIEEDMLEPLNFDNIPNFADIDPNLKNPEYDPENLYSVPYMWGLLGVIYNSAYIDPAEKDVETWDILWDEELSGDILMFNNSRDAIGIALKKLGYSYNTEDPAQVKEATNLLVEQKPLVQSYVMDEIFDKLEGENALIGAYYYGDFLTMQENNPDLAFALPREGTNLYVDAMCIPKGAENKENAEKWIDFMCRPDIAKRNFEYITYPTPNKGAFDLLDPELQENKAVFPDISSLKGSETFQYLGDEVDAKTESFACLSPEIRELYNSEWIRLLK